MNALKNLFDKKVDFKIATREKIPNIHGKTEAIFFDGIPYLGNKTTVFAYIGTPSAKMPEGGFPAVVLAHGGGGIAFHEWVEYWNGKGYVALSFDTGGRQYGSREHDSKGTAERNPSGRYVTPDDNGSFGNDEASLRGSWTYYNVASIISAHNLLRENENVNKEKIVLTGISWGGVLTAITSGIDDRFAAFAPVYGTGYLPECQVYTKNDVPKIKDFESWQAIYSPESYVINNKRPMLHTLGMNDGAFSPKASKLTYEKSKGKMLYSYRHVLPHYHRWQDNEQMIHVSKFFDFVTKKISLPFVITEERCNGSTISVKVDNPEAVKTAYFNCTDAKGGDCMLWKWEHTEIALNGSTASAQIPSDSKYFFIELTDGKESEFILSSAIYE